ncbi:MAG TPA: 1-acyl-sn-glycerol-3-phosphate acyltransferase [Saprospiraceae bacterium]|nr:1-acyl-sn-glycerol-3-phosphate acyltransferase [Saprospiraceae bacterium]
MVYYLTRILARIAIRIYFRKIYVEGVSHIPSDGPVFIAANHPNGFLEAILIACLVPRKLHFLVRGDVFKIKWLKPLLLATNQIPIFRSKDGFSNLRNNSKTLSAVTRALTQEKAILIFPEGTTQWVIRLRPLQKGMARMALLAMEESAMLKPKIVPAGVTFTNPTQFRSEVMISFGPSIKVTDFKDLYRKDQRDAIEQLTAKVYEQMKPQLVHVEDEDSMKFFKASELLRPAFPSRFFPFIERSNERLKYEQRIAEIIYHDEKVNREIRKMETPQGWGILDFIWIVPAIVGYLSWFFPFYLSFWITQKIARGSIFFASILLTGGALITLIYSILVLIFLIWIGRVYIVLFPLMVIGGICFLYLYEKLLLQKRYKEGS